MALHPLPFEKGKYELITFSNNANDAGFVIKCSSELGNDYQTSERELEFFVHNMAEKPQIVHSGEAELPFEFISDQALLIFKVVWDPNQEQKIEVNF